MPDDYSTSPFGISTAEANSCESDLGPGFTNYFMDCRSRNLAALDGEWCFRTSERATAGSCLNQGVWIVGFRWRKGLVGDGGGHLEGNFKVETEIHRILFV